MAKFHIKTGDTVVVIAGAHKGEQGKIVRMIPKQHRAIVEGVNLVTKHLKPSATNPQGGLEKVEAPLHVSNLMLLDSRGTATRTGIRVEANGVKVRVAKKTGEVIK
jgi:large subunit ribosomal protein L24